MPASADSSSLQALRNCESSGNYSANTGNGFYGAYQFTAQTWQSLGPPFSNYATPNLAPPALQDQGAVLNASRSGMGQWPVCGAGHGVDIRGSAVSAAAPAAASTAPSLPRWFRRVGNAPSGARAVTRAATTPTSRAPATGTNQGTSSEPWFEVNRASGAGVSRVQQALTNRGFGVTVDGVYGPQTATAVSHFEAAHGGIDVETPYGIVGPQVWGALFGSGRGVASHPSTVTPAAPQVVPNGQVVHSALHIPPCPPSPRLPCVQPARSGAR